MQERDVGRRHIGRDRAVAHRREPRRQTLERAAAIARVLDDLDPGGQGGQLLPGRAHDDHRPVDPALDEADDAAQQCRAVPLERGLRRAHPRRAPPGENDPRGVLHHGPRYSPPTTRDSPDAGAGGPAVPSPHARPHPPHHVPAGPAVRRHQPGGHGQGAGARRRPGRRRDRQGLRRRPRSSSVQAPAAVAVSGAAKRGRLAIAVTRAARDVRLRLGEREGARRQGEGRPPLHARRSPSGTRAAGGVQDARALLAKPLQTGGIAAGDLQARRGSGCRTAVRQARARGGGRGPGTTRPRQRPGRRRPESGWGRRLAVAAPAAVGPDEPVRERDRRRQGRPDRCGEREDAAARSRLHERQRPDRGRRGAGAGRVRGELGRRDRRRAFAPQRRHQRAAAAASSRPRSTRSRARSCATSRRRPATGCASSRTGSRSPTPATRSPPTWPTCRSRSTAPRTAPSPPRSCSTAATSRWPSWWSRSRAAARARCRRPRAASPS